MRNLLSVFFGIFLLLALAMPAYAQGVDWHSVPGCIEPVPGGGEVATLKCIPVVIQNLVNFAFAFVGVVAVIFIIISGIKLITSGGDPKQVEGARKTMMYAIIGLVVVILSFVIVNFVTKAAGVAGSIIGL